MSINGRQSFRHLLLVYAQGLVMTKTCSVAGCNTNHKKRVNGKSIISNPGTVFTFPNENKHGDLRREWVRFCNRKHAFVITNNTGICTKHFEEKR